MNLLPTRMHWLKWTRGRQISARGQRRNSSGFWSTSPLHGRYQRQAEDLLETERFPVYQTGRGGQYTYHGPGQRVAYVLLDLKARKQDIRAYVHALEDWVIQALAAFNVKGERRDGRVGIWVIRSDIGAALREDKIAAIGVRLKRWVSMHGISLNIDPDLLHFEGIVPCGISEHGVTSLHDLGQLVSMAEADLELRAAFETVFGPGQRFGRIDTSAPTEDG